MRYRLDDLEAFLYVVETGSISRAATELNLTKSVVSKRVSDLEEALGVVLLNRTTQGTVPTDEGAVFHTRGRAIMQQLDDAGDEIAADDKDLQGSLRISAPVGLTDYLGPIIATFLWNHPQLDATINVDDRVLDLQGGGYDLAIRVGRLPDSSLIARRLNVSRQVVCCSPDYAKRCGLPASLDEIAGHDSIGYTNVRSSYAWTFLPAKDGDESRSITVRSRHIANNGAIMRDMAIAGLGIAMFPVFIVAEALADGRLINAMPDFRPTSFPVHAVYTQARQPSRKLQALVAYLQAEFGGEPPWERLLSV
ncbi:MAG: LysR family transcriptional regulator [Rhodanobacteraceae bacterium]